MNPEQCEQWAQALESEKFKQCQGALFLSSYEVCCLGAANEIFNWQCLDTLSLSDNQHMNKQTIRKYVRYNDKQGLTFLQIAAIVRTDDELLDK